MPLRVITPPADEPVSLAEAKLHCKIEPDVEDDDALVSGLITAAREFVENQTHRAFVDRELELVLDHFPCREIVFPVTPVISVDSVKYDDDDGNEQTVDTDDYQVDLVSEPARIWPSVDFTWPSTVGNPNALRILFTAGYGDDGASGGSPADTAANVPQIAKQAILMIVAHWYANRETVLVGEDAREIPFAATVLMGQLQVYQ